MADYYSRIEDYDDWGISFHLLNLIQNRFGTFSIDWFASDHNAKVKRYFSRFWNISCLGVDAFTQSWAFEFGLFVPPITLITRLLKKMINDRAIGVLIIPCWRSAAFWPILCPDGRFVPSVVDWFDLPINKELFIIYLFSIYRQEKVFSLLERYTYFIHYGQNENSN